MVVIMVVVEAALINARTVVEAATAVEELGLDPEPGLAPTPLPAVRAVCRGLLLMLLVPVPVPPPLPSSLLLSAAADEGVEVRFLLPLAVGD